MDASVESARATEPFAPVADVPLAPTFTYRASRDLLEILSPDAAEQFWDDDIEIQSWASGAIRQLLDHDTPYFFYLHNGGRGRDGDQMIEVQLATDIEHAPNSALFRRLGGKSLVLIGVEKVEYYPRTSHTFLLIRVLSRPEIAGHSTAWSRLARVSFRPEDDGRACGIPPMLMAEISALPAADVQHQIIHRRLEDWRRYLGVLERTAREKTFSVHYEAWRLRGTTHVQLTLDTVTKETWVKVVAARNEEVHVGEIPADYEVDRVFAALDGEDESLEIEIDDWLLGSIEQVSKGSVVVRLDDDVADRAAHGSLRLPAHGVLRYKAIGDLVQIRRLRFGLEALERGRSANRYLGDFLFDAYEARLPPESGHICLAQGELLQRNLNEGQLAAVEGALNAPDLYLIQGPPGTGKTTVIAEICYQIALRGGRTLIASQANLAVDNAMSKLVHHPAIRALRRGRAESVEQEGQPYLEEHVISTWLNDVAADCRQGLSKQTARIETLARLVGQRTEIRSFAERCEAHHRTRGPLLATAQRSSAAVTDAEASCTFSERAVESAGAMIGFLSDAQAQGTSTALPLHSSPIWTPVEWDRLEENALHEGQEAVSVLSQEIERWQTVSPPTFAESKPYETHPSSPTSDGGTLHACIMNYLQGASDVLAVAREIERSAEERLEALCDLHQAGVGWYAALHQQQELGQQRDELQKRAASQRQTIEYLRQQIASGEGANKALHSVQLEAAKRRGIYEWLKEAVLRGTQDLPEPPPPFRSTFGKRMWAASLDAIGLAELVSLHDGYRAAIEQERALAQMTDWLKHIVDRMAAQARPEYVERELGLEVVWRNSLFKGLVSLDENGRAYPAPGARLVVQQIGAELDRLAIKPPIWQRLLGAEHRHQRQIARWAVLSSAALADLEGYQHAAMDHSEGWKATFQHHYDHSASTLQAALQSKTDEILRRSLDQLALARQRLSEAEHRAESHTKQIDDLEQRIAQLGRERGVLRGRLTRSVSDRSVLLPVAGLEGVLDLVGSVSEQEWQDNWHNALIRYSKMKERLTALLEEADPGQTVSALLERLCSERERLESKSKALVEALHAARLKRDAAQQELRVLDDTVAADQRWWTDLHESIPVEFLPPPGQVDADDPEYLSAVLSKSDTWPQALDRAAAYLRRTEDFVRNWIERVESGDERDQADLRQIYIDNANVIGITCVQAGSRRFSERYRNFDCVVIDEVSKATPPELLLPMLKGAKIILVGDSRQLPPMVGPDSLRDLAEELGVDKEDIAHLERSLFRELFEKCPDGLRTWLTYQYRMHPQIMDAINQFYADKLECRIPDPDRERAHNCQPLFAPDQHIAWVQTPLQSQFYETPVGTSYRNDLELEVIERLLEQIDAAWEENAGPDSPPKDVGVITFYGAQARELRQRLIDRPEETRFQHLRIRVGTVDRFQGMERPIIIASLVRNNGHGNIGFARAPERINVAFSRARELLVIVGCRELFCERARSSLAVGQYARVADVVRNAGGLCDVSTVITG